MAKRSIFIPKSDNFPFFKEELISFEWHSGLAKTQAQKSITSLHQAAAKLKISPILEISSKSASQLGVALSAFNLMLEVKGKKLSVECAYQGSKVFQNGGPHTDLYYASSRDAKTDERLRTSGEFVGYSFFGESFPNQPITAFYNWLYLKALSQNPNLANKLLEFQGFSDIVFNPNKSFNCQARAAALFVSLYQNKEIDRVLEDKNYYLHLITDRNYQYSLFEVKQNNTIVTITEENTIELDEQYIADDLIIKEEILHKVIKYLTKNKDYIAAQYNSNNLFIISDSDDIAKLKTIAEAFNHIKPIRLTHYELEKRVLPEHIVVETDTKNYVMGFLQIDSNNRSFTSRINNFNELVIRHPQDRFGLFRDERLPEINKGLSKKSIEQLKNSSNGNFVSFTKRDRIHLELTYQLIIDIQNKDLNVDLESGLKVFITYQQWYHWLFNMFGFTKPLAQQTEVNKEIR